MSIFLNEKSTPFQCWAKRLNKPLKSAEIEIKIESRFCLGLADLRQSYFSQFWFIKISHGVNSK